MSKNPHEGSTLQSFFEELGEWEDVEALAQKKIIAETLRREMVRQHVTKSELAKRMETSRSQLDAILNGDDPGLTLVSLSRASFALGLRPENQLHVTGGSSTRGPPNEVPRCAGSSSPDSAVHAVGSVGGLDLRDARGR